MKSASSKTRKVVRVGAKVEDVGAGAGEAEAVQAVVSATSVSSHGQKP